MKTKTRKRPTKLSSTSDRGNDRPWIMDADTVSIYRSQSHGGSGFAIMDNARFCWRLLTGAENRSYLVALDVTFDCQKGKRRRLSSNRCVARKEQSCIKRRQ